MAAVLLASDGAQPVLAQSRYTLFAESIPELSYRNQPDTLIVDPSNRTVDNSLLKLAWDLSNAERITQFYFKPYSPTWNLAGNDTGEFIGNAVAWDAYGTWVLANLVTDQNTNSSWQVTADGQTAQVTITSISSQEQGYPVTTRYTITADSPEIQVQRTFGFGSRPLGSSRLTPYELRGYDRNHFNRYAWQTVDDGVGTSIEACEYACIPQNWAQTWIDLQAPEWNLGLTLINSSGNPSSVPWLDKDGWSYTALVSALIPSIANGFSQDLTVSYRIIPHVYVTSTTSLDALPNPSVYGQSVTVTATVAGDGLNAPSGTVTFKDGSAVLASVPLTGGVASYSTNSLTAEPHQITAEYSGDTTFKPSSAGVSHTVTPIEYQTLYLPIVAKGSPLRRLDKIVYASGYTTANRVYNIYTMNSDGTGQTPLTNQTGSRYLKPTWSPDGTKIAFYSITPASGDVINQVYVMNADGSAMMPLVTLPGHHFHPAWSPSGNQIAFSSDLYNPGATTPNHIYVMNPSGSGTPVALTNSSVASDSWPDWSPDGRKIAYVSETGTNFEFSQIYVMNADGSGQTNISTSAYADYAPNWSPDGNKIVFSRNLGTSTSPNNQIFVMNANGSGQTQLTNNSGQNLYPNWSPDGTRLAFQTYYGNYADVYIMNADGSGTINITNHQFSYASVQADWR